jgi:prepilin-type processing-associated H-X9-DG protein
LSNLRQIGTGFILYANDNKQRLPSYGRLPDYPDDLWWYATLPKYMGIKPPAKLLVGINWLRCPSAEEGTYSTYGVNYGKDNQPLITYEGNPPTYPGSMKISQLKPGTMLAADSFDPQALAIGVPAAVIYSPLPGMFPLNVDFDGDGVLDSNLSILGVSRGAQFNHMALRHGGKRQSKKFFYFSAANMVFADGSARPVNVRDWAKNVDHMWGP